MRAIRDLNTLLSIKGIKLSGVLLIFALFAIPLPANSEESGLYVKGTVKDNHGVPLPDAQIFIHETGHTEYTDTSGHFSIGGLKPGSYHVHVYMFGFASTAKTINLRNSSAHINFQLRPSVLEIGEVVIEAQPYKLEDREKSLDLVIMEQKAMLRHGRSSFAETLERIPGIRSINTGKGIGRPMLRGLSFHRIAIVERGIKQEGQQWGADHGLEIDPYNIDRVEIIKGPNTILYGSDASGGVINIRTPSFPSRDIIRGNVTLNGQSNNNLLGGSALLEGNRNDIFFRVRYSRQDYGDYKVPADDFVYSTFVLPIHDNYLKNTAGEEQTITASTGIRRDWGNSQITISDFTQTAGLFPGAFGHPGSYSLEHEGDNRSIDLPRQVTRHTKVSSNNRILIGDNWFEADLGYQFNHRVEEAEPHVHDNRPLPETITHLDLQLHTYSSKFRYHHHHTDRLRGIYGISGRFMNNEIDGFEFLIPEHQSYDAGAFIYQHFRYSDDLTFNAGIRYDYSSYLSQAFEENTYNFMGEVTGTRLRAPEIQKDFSNISGTAGLSYQVSDQTSLKGNIARHFRVPRAHEMAANGFHHGTFRHEQGNKNLEAETGYQLDMSASFQESNFMVSASPFLNYYSNFVYLRPDYRFSTLPGGGQIYAYEQNEAVMWGGEIVSEYHPIDHLHLEAGFDYVWSKNLDSRLPLPLTPPASLFLESEYKFGTILKRLEETYLNLNVTFYADQNRTDRNERATEGAAILNLSTGTTINYSENNGISVYFQVQNLTNQRYLNHLSNYRILNIPEPGRNFTLTLSIPFHSNLDEH